MLIIDFINYTIGTTGFLLIAELCSLTCKLYLFIGLLIFSLRLKTAKKFLILLLMVLLGGILYDSAWILKFIKELFVPNLSYNLISSIRHIAWAFFIIQYQSLAFFLEVLISKKFKLNFRHYVFLIISSVPCCIFIYFAIFQFQIFKSLPYIRSHHPDIFCFIVVCMQASNLYIFPLIAPSLYLIFKKISSKTLPKILEHQLKIFVNILIIPHLLLELLTNNPFTFSFSTLKIPINNHAITSISTILITSAMYYCCKKMVGLRFLNFTNHVEERDKFNFINDFKDILETLSHITALNDLANSTQKFFEAAFSISLNKTELYIRKIANQELATHFENSKKQSIVENFIRSHDTPTCPIAHLLINTKIFIKDEIEFTNFYNEQPFHITILEFLDAIDADIFLPIYERQTISGYIIIKQNARPNNLYSSVERDEMLVFSSYLSSIINILKHGNLDALLQKEKDLKEELYHRNEEINQYKESIKYFLRSSNERKLGIIFYKTRRFVFANQAAKELISFDINSNEGHPMAQDLKGIVRKVQQSGFAQTSFVRDTNGNKLILSGVPSLEPNNVIIIIYYPEISDIIKSQFDQFKDPSVWDYLLYLETTSSGQLINQLIPGMGKTLLNFKIHLLATALSKKAILLEMPEEDLIPTIEILHHISLRQNLHILKLTTQEKSDEITIKLFGINPLFNSKEESEPLLQKLDNTGTLFIQNIHLLSLNTQNYLAQLITYGFYHKLKSDHKIFCDVRIICSTTKSLHSLVAKDQFSKSLFDELKKNSLIMPSLITLPESEIIELAHGFTEQALKTQTFKMLLQITDKDQEKLLNDRAASLQEFKARVFQLLIQKSTKQKIHDTAEFDPAYYISDPEIAQAVRLGKKALKDPHIMELLWQKFKNQNKIATLLGVNRSSVNRRCKDYKF